MKNLTLILGFFLLVLNVLIGLMYSSYKPFNLGLNSAVIIINTLMIYSLGIAQIKDGFRIPLVFLFLIAAIIEFILGFFVPESWKNNFALTGLILLVTAQMGLYVITYFVSKIN